MSRVPILLLFTVSRDIATANRSAFTQQTASAGSSNSDTISVLPGNGDGTFGTASALALGDPTNPFDGRFLASIRSLNTADVNGDKTPDLVVSGGAILMSRPAGAGTATGNANP